MDLNLVKVFVSIFETRSLTDAGARLFVTQSAISQSLGKLRTQLNDQLFERVGRQMEPTQLAEQIYPKFRSALLSIDTALDQIDSFDPAISQRTFRIALSELGELGWFPAVSRALLIRAPHIRLEVVTLVADQVQEWLSRGNVDVAITPLHLPNQADRAYIKSEGYLAVMSKDNPLAIGEIDLPGYAGASHLVVAGDTAAPVISSHQRSAGIAIRPQLVAQRFAVVPRTLRQLTNFVATVPETLGRMWSESGDLVVKELPFEVPPVDIFAYKRQTTDAIGALDWIFARVQKTLSTNLADLTPIGDQKG